MTTTIEHVRHRVEPGLTLVGGYPDSTPTIAMHHTTCGRRFIGVDTPDRNTRHHEPATSRCPECWR